MANDYIDGLDDNAHHQPRPVSINKVSYNLPVSAKNMGHKPIHFDEIK